MLGWWIVVSEGQPDGVLDARFGVAYAHRKSIAARLFLATHSHYYFSFIP